MSRLPCINELTAAATGWGFFLCARKELRTGRGGEYLAVVLQDTTGEIGAKVFQDVNTIQHEFDAGEFVKAQGRGNAFNQKLELVLEKIRRVIPDRDALDGFREEDCIPVSPRSGEDMWRELQSRLGEVRDPHIRTLLARVIEKHGDRLRIWPAAQKVHHAYKGGLLEHVLKILEVALFLADAYGANRDIVLAGVILHDIGKLEELVYDVATEYSLEGNLVGHITIGVGMVRQIIAEMPDFPAELEAQLIHLILSHHGAREKGSPVEPMTVEAFILAAADDLDATIHQVRHHIADDDSSGPFTSYHRRLERVLLKPPQS